MALPVPAFDLDSTLAPFAAIAVAMVAITVIVLGFVRPTDGRPPLVTQALLALSVVGGGSVLLLALLFVFLDPNGTDAWTWVLLAFNFMMTAPAGLWFVGHILFRDRRILGGAWLWPAALGVAVTGSEVLMGVLFVVGGVNGSIGATAAVAFGLSAVWFFWSMAGVMAPLVLWAPLSPVARAGGWALVAAAVVGPWVRPYPLVGGLAMSALMGAAFVAVLRHLLRGRAAAADAPLLVALASAFLGMTLTGLAVAASGAAVLAVLAFGATMALVMVTEVSYLLRRSYADSRPLRLAREQPLAPEGSGSRPGVAASPTPSGAES
ncbi:MAG TPA: hypothetical protein VMH49_04760 [Thermoplasmata archaeon]|nr:hypothetical protein [Thermoplasmata archaeon]